MSDKKVGTKTNKTTQVGRPVYKTANGEMVSEKSTTFKYKGQWINIPTIHKGFKYDQETLKKMLNAGIITPTSTHENEPSASKAARERSNRLKYNKGGMIDYRKTGLFK